MPSPYYAQVGRVKSYLKNLDPNLLPVSCTICVPRWDQDFYDATCYLVEYCIESLRAGVGVNVHLDYFEYIEEPYRPTDVSFNLKPSHPDANKFKGTTVGNPLADCVVNIKDSLSGEGGIIDCLKDAIYALDGNGTYVFDFSELRPEGKANKAGMVASGPDSFRYIYECTKNFILGPSIESLLALISSFNQEIRRGGTFKNGAITTSLPWWHKSFKNYVLMPKSGHPWLKKSVVVTQDFVNDPEALYLIEDGINDGSLFIEKALDLGGNYIRTKAIARCTVDFNRLRHNVCREVLIRDGQTCTLGHVNAGMCSTPREFEDAMVVSMVELLSVHYLDAPGKHPTGLYMPRSEDMQIGLGMIGFANLIGYLELTYQQFTDQLKDSLLTNGLAIKELCHDQSIPLTPKSLVIPYSRAGDLVRSVISGYIKAARLAHMAGMDRAFCLAPTANSSFKHQDTKGYTTAPNISPPVARRMERISTVGGQDEANYGTVEIASEVGFQTYSNLVDSFQYLFKLTGLAHSISYDIWEDVDEGYLRWFNDSHITATYYRLRVDQSYLDKSQVGPVGGAITCDCAG